MEYFLSSVHLALDKPETAWIALIVFATLFIRAAIGFGDGLIAVPLLSFFMNISEAVPLILFLSSSMSIIAYWRDCQQTQLGSLGRTAIAALIGFPLGAVFLSLANPELVKGVLGAVLIVLAIWQLWIHTDIKLKGTLWSYIFGLLAGILGSAYALRGVVFAIYGGLRGWSPAQFKSTIHGFYIISGLMVPFVFFAGGLVTQRIIGLYLLMLPLAIIATLFGGSATRKLDALQFQKIIWWCLLTLGILFVLRFTFALLTNTG